MINIANYKKETLSNVCICPDHPEHSYSIPGTEHEEILVKLSCSHWTLYKGNYCWICGMKMRQNGVLKEWKEE